MVTSTSPSYLRMALACVCVGGWVGECVRERVCVGGVGPDHIVVIVVIVVVVVVLVMLLLSL